MKRTATPVLGRCALIVFGFGAILLGLASGCAKLPMENTPPAAPVLTSDGIVGAFGVEILVFVDDVDGDMVTVQLQAAPSGTGTPQTFSWTSFFPSGQEEAFFITLPVGQWTITAQARDELDEESASSTLNLTVALP